MATGRYSIGGPPHIWAALITADDPSTPAHLDHLRQMEEIASTCIRLANDLQSYQKEIDEGKINALVILSPRAARAAASRRKTAYRQAEARVQADILAGLDQLTALRDHSVHADRPPRSRDRQHRPLRLRLLHPPRLPHVPGAGGLTVTSTQRERRRALLLDPRERARHRGRRLRHRLDGQRARRTSERRVSRFPTTLRWLADNQLADGSWGGSVRYEHDRIICTLAALAPLAEFGRRAEDRARRRRRHALPLAARPPAGREPVELVGFELLLPTLVDRARAPGVAVPPHLDVYAAQRDEEAAS